MPVRKGKKNQVLKTNAVSSSSAADTVDKQMSEKFSRGQDLGLTGMLAANYLENKNLAMKSVYFLLCRFHIFILLHCEYFIPYYSQN